MLQRLTSFETYEATNGEEALSVVKEKKPSIVILDIQMPVMNGIETLKRIRKKPKIYGNPYIFIFSALSKNELQKTLKMGANDILNKPCNLDEFYEKITCIKKMVS